MHVTKCKGDPKMWKIGICFLPVANGIPLRTSCCSYAAQGKDCNSVCYKGI